MPNITVLSGHSGAGKSTIAAQLFWRGSSVPCALITQDHHRFEEGTDTTEFFINLAKVYYDRGISVIMDGVNLHPLDKERWTEVFPKVEWRQIITPFETCVARDSLREHPVGEENIKKQAQDWPGGICYDADMYTEW